MLPNHPYNPHTEKSGGFIAFFADNHVAANMLMLFLLVAGIISLANMRRQFFPNIDPYTISISVSYPGATPEEVDEGVTARVEAALIGLDGVKRVTSQTRESLSIVTVSVENYADVNEVRDDIEREIDRLTNFPPQNAEDPVIIRNKPSALVLDMVLYGDVGEKVLKYWASKIENDLPSAIAGSSIEILGDRNYEISIRVSEEKLRRYNLSMEHIARIVRDFSRNIPGGVLEHESGDISLLLEEKGETGYDFGNIPVLSHPDGTKIRLRDVATIHDGFEPKNVIGLYNDKPAVLFSIKHNKAQDLLKTEQAVLDYARSLQLPAALALESRFSAATALKSRLNLLARNAVLGFALVFIILVLFFDLKLAFWITSGIAVSFLGGLFCVHLMGLSLNMISTFALIIVLGIIVDDAIVVGESIFHEQEDHHAGPEGKIKGIKSVFLPVLVGVLTTLVAFAGLLCIPGTMGQIAKVIPVVVISILLISLLEAFLILPSHLSSSKRWSVGIVAVISRRFSALLENFTVHILVPFTIFLLRWRYAGLAVFIGILLMAAGAVKGDIVRFIYFPYVESEIVSAELTMPAGTPFKQLESHARQMLLAAKTLQKEINQASPGQKDIYESTLLLIGDMRGSYLDMEGGGSGAQSKVAQLLIKIPPAGERRLSAKDIENRLREKIGPIPNAEKLTFISGEEVQNDADITLEIFHPDFALLSEAARKLREHMARINGVTDISDNLSPLKREYAFRLKEAGIAAGLSNAELGQQIRSAFYGYEVQRLQRGREELKVMVRLPEEDVHSLETLSQLRITLPNGERAPLYTVSEILEKRGLSSIERTDGRSIVNIYANTLEAVLTPNEAIEKIFADILPELEKDYPGLSVTLEGESKDQREEMAVLALSMLTALMIIFFMLGVLFRSYIQPFIVLSAIPFGIIGAVGGHMIMGYDLSILSMFGIVALSGVIVNNSIVLIDYFNQKTAAGMAPHEALIQAARRRFRPILFTTLTTSASLLPLIMETSVQAQFLIPMAISLSFGLLFGLLIIIFLVPIFLAIVEDIRKL